MSARARLCLGFSTTPAIAGAVPTRGRVRSACAGPLLIEYEFPLSDGGGVVVLHIGRVRLLGAADRRVQL
jgi:hypothetical protein